MTRYDRNKEYLDQIYYAIGNLYLSRRDTVNAIANYEEAVEKSTRNGIDKAMTQLTLGGLYYDLGDYVKAQPCYSEALPLIPDTYPDYKMLKRRSDNLDELAVYAQNVTLQDSLLKALIHDTGGADRCGRTPYRRTEEKGGRRGRGSAPRGDACQSGRRG